MDTFGFNSEFTNGCKTYIDENPDKAVTKQGGCFRFLELHAVVPENSRASHDLYLTTSPLVFGIAPIISAYFPGMENEWDCERFGWRAYPKLKSFKVESIHGKLRNCDFVYVTVFPCTTINCKGMISLQCRLSCCGKGFDSLF